MSEHILGLLRAEYDEIIHAIARVNDEEGE